MDHPPAGPLNAPRGPGVLAELAHQALLAGLCQHFALPFAGELAADKGYVNMAVSCLFRAGPGSSGRGCQAAWRPG
jgi:hypothetical protein